MKARLLLLAATTACIVTADVPLQACSCMPTRPPCQTAWYASAIFVGQVVRIDTAPSPVTPMGGRRLVTFRVTETLRGDLAETEIVGTGSGGGDCGYDFTSSGVYLVYAHRGPDGALSTGICDRTRPVGQARDDLAYLRGPARQPSVLGTLQGVARMPDPRVEYQPFDRAAPYVGGRVVVESTDGSTARHEAVTGADGRFSIRAPVGRYRATLHVREGLYAINSFVPEILDARGCAEIEFVVRPDGRLRGRILDADGRPVPALSVETLRGTDVPLGYFNSSTRARTDADGRFEFTQMAPGAYMLGLTLRRDNRGVASTAIWLSPAADDVPTRVTLAPEEKVSAGDLRLPASVQLAAIAGTVADPDGSPATAARVYVLTAPAFGIAAGPLDVDAHGAFSFTLVAGRTYRLSAEMLDGPGRLRRAESAPFTATANLPPFALTMTRTSEPAAVR